MAKEKGNGKGLMGLPLLRPRLRAEAGGVHLFLTHYSPDFGPKIGVSTVCTSVAARSGERGATGAGRRRPPGLPMRLSLRLTVPKLLDQATQHLRGITFLNPRGKTGSNRSVHAIFGGAFTPQTLHL